MVRHRPVRSSKRRKITNATFEQRSLFCVSGTALAIKNMPACNTVFLLYIDQKIFKKLFFSFVNCHFKNVPRYINALFRKQTLNLKVSYLSKPFDKLQIFKHKLKKMLSL